MRPKIRHTPPTLGDSGKPLLEPGGNLSEWRGRRLLRAGVPVDLAVEIAANCAIDLHAMIGLLEAGCPAELAARILAPLEAEDSPC